MPAILSTRAIKRKVRSVSNIKKITRAMQMVSAAKLKKVQVRLTELRPYADKIVEFMANLSAQVGDLEYPLFTPRAEVKKIGVVVFMADKGLCGSYNSNMARYVQKFLDAKKKPFSTIPIGKKAVDGARKQGVEVKAQYQQLPTDLPFSQIKAMSKQLVDWFTSGEVDEVHLLFTRYVNAITFQPGDVQFLPIKPPEPKAGETAKAVVEVEFEPEPAALLDQLTPRYVEVSFHRLLLESMSSEHAARMNAMRNATDSASDIITSLTLQYNNARQAGITRELLDIVGGAEALKG
ncbi:MAG TPA: ATP synthase F1 subunit gamma [Planctomycetota bacterium]|nr:ATP synthase F1 subunit gamma [Planctomycetota bacterium]